MTRIVGKLNANKKVTEENIKKAELEFKMDLKILILETAKDVELTRAKSSKRCEDRETAPDGYMLVIDNLLIRCCLVFVDDQMSVPIELRRQVLDIWHFRHSGMTKMDTEANVFLWTEPKNDIETKVKDCTERLT